MFNEHAGQTIILLKMQRGVPRPRDVSARRLTCRFQYRILMDDRDVGSGERGKITAPEGTVPKGTTGHYVDR